MPWSSVKSVPCKVSACKPVLYVNLTPHANFLTEVIALHLWLLAGITFDEEISSLIFFK